MAIKQRLLARLQALENTMLHAMETGTREAWATVCQELAATKEQCRQGMPESGFFAYGEIYDGLILATQQIAADTSMDARQEVSSLCRELLQNLIGETGREKRFKKEFVFLPYKSSMWDSLESVWKAAVEDKEHCNAYVIPIPYADLNPDRSAAEWHVEHDFPSYVPILDWQSIDLKAMHPDAIFIHNAYDDSNLVTSVDSRYYSRNLKDFTEKLVYIPYAVENEVQPGNKAVEESISHRVLQPGVLNAHLVIAQSEDTRQAWINILVRHTNMKDRSYWEARVLGLGSPKIDKVLTSKREDFELPEKWKRLVEGRKVILYNTSLGAMLQNSDKVCDKLRYVFDVFRDRKDVVLWWRPHPLMKATFHSMRPQFEEEYLSLEKQYIEEGWGIYDDSPDLHRAICWSDAYYGDGSSVVTLYEKTGKPVMIQNMYLNDRSYRRMLIRSTKPRRCYIAQRAIVSDQWCIEGEKAWFLSISRNELYQVDMRNNIISLQSRAPEESMKWRGITHCCKYGDYIYCLPDNEKCIWQYAMQAKEWKKIPYDVPSATRLSIYEYWVLESEILFYSRGMMEFFLMSTKDGEIQKCDNIPGGTAYGMNYRFAGVERVRNFIYVVSSTQNVYQYDIENGCIRKSQMIFPCDMTIIRYDGRAFWLSGRDKNIYEWDEEQSVIRTYNLPDSFGLYNYDKELEQLIDTKTNEYPHTTFIDARVVNGYVWFFPFQTSDIVYIDIETKDLKIFPIKEEKETCESMYVRVLNYKYIVEYVREDRYIGLLSLKNTWIIEIDTVKMNYEIKTYDTTNIPAEAFGKEELIGEDVLRLALDEENSTNKRLDIEAAVGKSIYRYI